MLRPLRLTALRPIASGSLSRALPHSRDHRFGASLVSVHFHA